MNLMAQKNDQEDLITRKKTEIENYKNTLFAIEALILLMQQSFTSAVFEPKFTVGRTMNFFDDKDSKCTPDVVMQIKPDHGVIAEMKMRAGRNILNEDGSEKWGLHLRQLRKYDRDLIGWWDNDGVLPNVNLLYIISIVSSAEISDYISSKLISREEVFSHPLGILEFSQILGMTNSLFLRRRWGDVPEEMSSILSNGYSVSTEELLARNAARKFYDSPPCEEYVMQILWQNVFTEHAKKPNNDDVFYNEELKIWEFPINTSDVTHELQKYYGSVGGDRQQEMPKKAWVDRAMRAFVTIGLATKLENEDEYKIHYKKIRKPLDNFITQLSKNKKRKSETPAQLPFSFMDSFSQNK